MVLGMSICSEAPLGYSKRARGAPVLPTWCSAVDMACAGQTQFLGKTALLQVSQHWLLELTARAQPM